MKHLLRILSFAKPYSGYAILNAVSNLFYTLFSLLSLGTIIPVLDIIFNQQAKVYELLPWTFDLEVVKNNFNYYVTEALAEYGVMDTLLFICGITAVAFLFKNLFQFLALFFLAPLRTGVVNDLRIAVHKKCLELPIFFFSEKRKGDVMARMSTDVTEIEWSILTSLEMIVREPLMIIGSLGILVYISPRLTLFIFLVLPISALIISVIGKSLKRSSTRAQGQLGYVLSVIEETLTGLRIIKGFNAEKRIDEKFRHASGDYRRSMIKVLNKKDASSPLSEFLGATVMLMVVWYGGKLVVVDGELTGGTLIAFVGFFYQIIPAFKSLTQAIYNVQKGNASSERILEILDAHNPITDADGAVHKSEFHSEIEFRNVTFSYNQDSGAVLSDINFTIAKGRTVALVGPSGSGKTTISNLLPRFYDIRQGHILIDGEDIRNVRIHDLRALMGIVNQESILFNDTVANNIALGKPEASIEEIRRAAEIANAHTFIQNLDHGYDTNIGEGGNKLSGGQKQRISIARAVLEDPPILILDEATSALDTESEKLVQDALNRLMENRTSLIIAHRLSTIMHADEILVLDDGVIVERGNHEELLAREGLYHKLCQMQSFT
ncbi:MAG: ABC transporter ATP-binding protein/permease [Bacteroidota bacterium]|nr:ABC transporter ATP-binding protein/permease [Bacteroidota bacterium]MDX5429098.1 ABC transporter ATP-binding protein/permease [Bacteroidota bacterium]MDX5448813.1 ABC transporter ATP-binding protein/permease [Bacteroidota bacterium]MDX5506747.1 ABC transporter ATP-binding protein/permease [Bacteroidota bacterium]